MKTDINEKETQKTTQKKTMSERAGSLRRYLRLTEPWLN